MGRAIGLVAFVLLFIVFFVIKAALQGGKAAYNAVFNPNAKDEAVMRVIGMIVVTVQEYMRQNYSGSKSELPYMLTKCTNEAQKLIEANGFSAPISITESIVKKAIIDGGFASAHELT
jgi:heme/copper-type cytochrome/quinol oxidase subunit 2